MKKILLKRSVISRPYYLLLAAFFFTVFFSTSHAQEQTMQITSPAFAANQTIPTRFTCQGENINPPLAISGIPEGAQTMAPDR